MVYASFLKANKDNGIKYLKYLKDSQFYAVKTYIDVILKDLAKRTGVNFHNWSPELTERVRLSKHARVGLWIFTTPGSV